jgi:hypothetical protein
MMGRTYGTVGERRKMPKFYDGQILKKGTTWKTRCILDNNIEMDLT